MKIINTPRFKILLVYCLIVIMFCTTSCSDTSVNEVGYVPFYRKVARNVSSDGWVFSFIDEEFKEEKYDSPGHIRYSFFGFNLRYAAVQGYYDTYTREGPDNTVYIETVIPTCTFWGEKDETQKSDSALINEIIDSSREPEELLALNQDEFNFQDLDKDMFFGLMKDALNGEPQNEGKLQSYWDKPTYAMLAEPMFLDGYKFQVAFLMETGLVDELYIDVLFEDPDSEIGYCQLSDMIDLKTADESEVLLWDTLSKIKSDILETNLYISDRSDYKDQTYDEVQLSRLYQMLLNIHNNEYDQYVRDPETVSFIEN